MEIFRPITNQLAFLFLIVVLGYSSGNSGNFIFMYLIAPVGSLSSRSPLCDDLNVVCYISSHVQLFMDSV